MIFIDDKPVYFIQHNGKMYRVAEKYFDNRSQESEDSSEDALDTEDSSSQADDNAAENT